MLCVYVPYLKLYILHIILYSFKNTIWLFSDFLCLLITGFKFEIHTDGKRRRARSYKKSDKRKTGGVEEDEGEGDEEDTNTAFISSHHMSIIERARKGKKHWKRIGEWERKKGSGWMKRTLFRFQDMFD